MAVVKKTERGIEEQISPSAKNVVVEFVANKAAEILLNFMLQDFFSTIWLYLCKSYIEI